MPVYGGNESGGGVNWVAPGPGNTNTPAPGGVSQGGAAAPAAPAPNLKSMIPGSAAYQSALGVAQNAYNNAQSQVTYNRGQTASQYGFLLDKNGAISGVDPNNPHGLYQQERMGEAQQTLQGLAAQRGGGWGGGGMIANALARAKQGIGQGMYNMGRQLDQTMHGYIQQLADAKQAQGQAGDVAFQNAWQLGISSGNYDPVSGAAIPDPNAPPPAAATPAPYSQTELNGRKVTYNPHGAPAIKTKPVTVKPKTVRVARRP